MIHPAWWLRLLAMLLVLGLGANTARAEEQAVRLWHAYRGGEAEALTQAAEQFTRETGVVIQLTATPFGAFEKKLETAIPRSNGPDLFIAAHGNLGKWQDLKLMESVEDPPEPSEQHATALDALRENGALWAQPLALKTLLLFSDPALINTPPTTTDDLIAQAQAARQGEIYGLVYQAGTPFFHATWMHGFGAAALGPNGADLNTPEHIAAYAFTQRLANDLGIMPKRPTAQLLSQLYNDGRAAFVISGPWFMAEIDRPVRVSALPIISENGQPAKPYLSVEAIFLAKHAKRPQAAAQFAAWLSGADGALIRQTVGQQAVTATGLPPSKDPVIRAVLEQSKQAIPLPTDPDISNVWRAQEKALEALISGAASPERTAERTAFFHSVYSRPAPTPANPTPYWLLMFAVLGAAGLWIRKRVQDRALRTQIRAHKKDYLWVLPAGLAMVVLVALPFVMGAAVSLYAHHGGEWTFVGLSHFWEILSAKETGFTSPMSFWYTLVVTLLWTATNLILHVSIGVGLALLLREPWIRMRGLWRALLILPWAIPNYITALIWKTMFHVQYGAVNALLGFGGEPVELDWFGSFSTAFSANLITNTWLGFPFMMVVTLGALQAIPRELEEAAEVDGASWWMRFRHVVWPLLKPALLPAIILGSVWTFNMFNVVYLVSNGGPMGGTEILISDAYQWAFSGGNYYGYAAAYAVLIFVVLILYSRFANRIAGRRIL
jgi:arabinogalactan oligomer/maltooligosaccharide transport system permease protein